MKLKILYKITKAKSHIKTLEVHLKSKEIRYIKKGRLRNFIFIRCGSICIQTLIHSTS